MRYALCLLCLIVGCGRAPLDLTRTVTVDELCEEWETNAGRIRAWDGKEVTVRGQCRPVKLAGEAPRTLRLLGHRKPSSFIDVTLADPWEDEAKERFPDVTVRGTLVVSRGVEMSLVRAVTAKDR